MRGPAKAGCLRTALLEGSKLAGKLPKPASEGYCGERLGSEPFLQDILQPCFVAFKPCSEISCKFILIFLGTSKEKLESEEVCFKRGPCISSLL